MIRPVPLLLVMLACVLGAHIAKAQDADSELMRVDRLEETIRNLTGQVEQLQYRDQQLEQQVQRLQQQMQGGAPAASTPPASAQYSPPQYSQPSYSQPSYSHPSYSAPSYPPPAAQYSPPPAAAAGEPTDHSHDAFNPRLDPNAPGVPHPLGTSTNATEPPPIYQGAPAGAAAPRQAGAPLDLSNLSAPQGAAPAGRLPPPPPTNPSATGGAQASMEPPPPVANTPKDEYELGQGYFERKDYAQAVQTFRVFLRQYPSDRLTPEAQFYLGEALFQSQQYHDAAEAFLTVSTKYETMARAPDALLRLGESLAALGQKEAACASLGEVLRKYPRASLSVKESVAREQKRAHC
ncbi:MAG TPA: tol-pal system protein YbgF [Xanthobacteraceae bacterium]|nr:tol-pal system protein YbgF [Xanthobacteraceae bacterium]